MKKTYTEFLLEKDAPATVTTGVTPTGTTTATSTPSKPSRFSENLNRITTLLKNFWATKPIKPQAKSEALPPEDNSAQKIKYEELLKQWKEEQQKSGKNVNPGEGTRQKLWDQAKQSK